MIMIIIMIMIMIMIIIIIIHRFRLLMRRQENGVNWHWSLNYQNSNKHQKPFVAVFKPWFLNDRLRYLPGINLNVLFVVNRMYVFLLLLLLLIIIIIHNPHFISFHALHGRQFSSID